MSDIKDYPARGSAKIIADTIDAIETFKKALLSPALLIKNGKCDICGCENKAQYFGTLRIGDYCFSIAVCMEHSAEMTQKKFNFGQLGPV